MVVDDIWETPQELYDQLCEFYGVRPELDVCADKFNKKCQMYMADSLNEPWTAAVWCNPPHSKTKAFVEKAAKEWKEQDISILMIIPANSVCTKYAQDCIQNKAEINPIYGRPRFLKDGKPSKFPSRNSYFSVFWKKQRGGCSGNQCSSGDQIL